MKITNLSLEEKTYPLKTPFVTALRRVDAVEAIHVRLDGDNGLFGYGAASPTAVITGDTKKSIEDALRHLGSLLIGKDMEDLNDHLELISKAIVNNTSAKAAMDLALHDLYCQSRDISLREFLGGGAKTLDTDLTISLGDRESMVGASKAAEERGFASLKIKLGREGKTDFSIFRDIARSVGCSLRIDANQGWSVKETLAFMDRCDKEQIEIDFLEQPVDRFDIRGMAFIRQRINCPLVADESVFSPADALRVIEEEGADIINIKLMKCGGIYQARRIAALAAAARKGVMLGCMMESPVGVAGALQLASSWPEIRYIDLDVPYLLKDIPEGYGFSCGESGSLLIR